METVYTGNHPTRPKAILFGNRVAPYHPLGAVEGPLRSVFEGLFELEVVDGFDSRMLRTKRPALVIGYEDRWEEMLNNAAAEALQQYLQSGGGLLLIHNGICWARHPVMHSIVGGMFTGHPDQEVMDYRVNAKVASVISETVQGFSMREEPYRYALEQSIRKDVFLEYHQDGKWWEAGWKRNVGSGRIICIQPGHYPEVFENENYQKLLIACARWCSGLSENF